MKTKPLKQLEALRLEAQQAIDSQKDSAERNRLGQFATPPRLADDLIRSVASLATERPIRSFADPAFGTGAFYSALLRVSNCGDLTRALGFEIDTSFVGAAQSLWRQTGLNLHEQDFLAADPNMFGGPVDLLVCNPPYVRHHHIPQVAKARLRTQVLAELGITPSGLSGLYLYFMLLADKWLAPGGIAAWLVPGEFLDVNYGSSIKEYLSTRVALTRIHRFRPEDVQFADALVSSVVVFYCKALPGDDSAIEFTSGDGLAQPLNRRVVSRSQLRAEDRWSRLFAGPPTTKHSSLRLADLFKIKRGIATGANEFFVLTSADVGEHDLPAEVLTPILPPPRLLKTEEIESSPDGTPVCEPALFLLDVRDSLDQVKAQYPAAADYLAQGEPLYSARYLCRKRRVWYLQERREPPPLLCTYMGRKTANDRAPFRFILNHSRAVATNVYLMLYPRPSLERAIRECPSLLRDIWQYLTFVSWPTVLSESRVYGGGLHKLEPRELGNLKVDSLLSQLPATVLGIGAQRELFISAGA